MQANEKKPRGLPNAISQKKRRVHEDVGVSDPVVLVPRSSATTPKPAGQVGRTPWLSAQRGLVSSSRPIPPEVLAAIFDQAINSEFCSLVDELTQRNPDAYRPPRIPSLLAAVCTQWRSILVSKPSMWRRISFSLSENDELCDIPVDYSSSLKLAWQYRYMERAKALPLDVVIHRWSSTESNYITNLFDALFRLPPDARGASQRTTNFFRSLVITSAGGSIPTGAHVEPWPLRYCAPDVSLVSFGRQDWAALRPLLCSAQNLELYQSATLPYQGCLAETTHLFMEFTDGPCEEILPSHAVQHIIENAPKLQSLAVGYTTTGSPLPRGLGDEFAHPALEHLQLSPNDLGSALSAFEHGLSAPNVSRITLLELPPTTPDLAARWARFAANIAAGRVARLDIDALAPRLLPHGADTSWRALLAPFAAVAHLAVHVHPPAGAAAVLRALLPAAPHDASRRLLPRVRRIALTRPSARAFAALRALVADRLRLARAGAPWVAAVTHVDIYDYDAGAFSALEWRELAGLLEDARAYYAR